MITAKQLSDNATNKLNELENKDWPVPGNAAQSVTVLVYQAGFEAAREAIIRQLRGGGFNIQANNALDLKVS